MNQRSAQVQKYREQQREYGLCDCCPKKAEPGSRLCHVHREKARLRSYASRHRLKPGTKRRMSREFRWYMENRERLEGLPSTPTD